MKPVIVSSWLKDLDVDLCKPTFVYVDKAERLKKHGVHIFINSEEEAVKPLLRFLLKSWQDYDVILTHKPKVIERCSNAQFFIVSGAWVYWREPYAAADWDLKTFGVSTVVGHKNTCPGHKKRHQLWDRQDGILIPKWFYCSNFGSPPGKRNNPVLIGYKSTAMHTQFHIAIENSSEAGCFSEKLLDCFMTRSVPIYWGCPDIGKFFDARGIICVDSVDDIISAVNKLTVESYAKFLPFIEMNLHLALQYADDPKEKIKRKLLELVGPA